MTLLIVAGQIREKITGMNPKAIFGNRFREQAAGYYTLNIVPLSFARGIIQLTDITALRL
jgi:hypothetical protein